MRHPGSTVHTIYNLKQRNCPQSRVSAHPRTQSYSDIQSAACGSRQLNRVNSDMATRKHQLHNTTAIRHREESSRLTSPIVEMGNTDINVHLGFSSETAQVAGGGKHTSGFKDSDPQCGPLHSTLLARQWPKTEQCLNGLKVAKCCFLSPISKAERGG